MCPPPARISRPAESSVCYCLLALSKQTNKHVKPPSNRYDDTKQYEAVSFVLCESYCMLWGVTVRSGVLVPFGNTLSVINALQSTCLWNEVSIKPLFLAVRGNSAWWYCISKRWQEENVVGESKKVWEQSQEMKWCDFIVLILLSPLISSLPGVISLCIATTLTYCLLGKSERRCCGASYLQSSWVTDWLMSQCDSAHSLDLYATSHCR